MITLQGLLASLVLAKLVCVINQVDLKMEGTSNSPQKDVLLEITKEDGSLVSSIKEKMEKVSLSPCICRVPESLNYRENEEKYFPTFISIGPFHHGKGNLRATEDQKWCYLNTLFARKPNVQTSLGNGVKALKEMESNSNVETSLDKCVKALKEIEFKARNFYSEEISLPSNEFVKMMLLDGCFIIELFLTSSIKGLRRRDDPFFSTFESSYRLRCDLILLENQIPFFVLQRLFHLIPVPKQCTKSLTQLALHFFRRLIQGDVHVLEEKFSQEFKHLLDLIHQCHLPTYPESRSSGSHRNLHSAIKIQKAGITLKRNKTDLSLLDIKFVNRVLEIPTLKIHNYTEILLRNLIAMEISVHGCTKKVTSYVFLMGDLIQSKDDLRLLCKRDIIVKGFENEEEILDLLKRIRVEVNANDFYYRGICDEVNGYGRSETRNLCRKIKHVCSKTPFGLAGFVIAILILVFTFTGILFSLLTFSLHHHF